MASFVIKIRDREGSEYTKRAKDNKDRVKVDGPTGVKFVPYLFAIRQLELPLVDTNYTPDETVHGTQPFPSTCDYYPSGLQSRGKFTV